jgi:hypothetical protein
VACLQGLRLRRRRLSWSLEDVTTCGPMVRDGDVKQYGPITIEKDIADIL